jgi:selenocysteine lyase/cysteine desulfurase
MSTRRTFLGLAAGAGMAAFRDDGLERVLAAGRAAEGRLADAVAQEEDFWREIQQAFTVNRSYVNLNNGGVSPSPRIVQEAMKRYLDLSNEDNGIGVELRAARMRVLRDRWMRRLSGQRGVRIFTSFDPAMSCGIGTVQIEGVNTRRLAAHLFDRRRIIVVPIVHEDFEGLRVTPNVYTTLDEVDLFAEEMEAVIARGLPASPTPH